MNVGLFDRDGHLSELGLDRLTVEPETLAAETIAAAHEHLAGCARCRATQAEIALAPAQAETLLAAAKSDHDRGIVVEPVAIAFDPAARMPLGLRERIRALGPTVAIPGTI